MNIIAQAASAALGDPLLYTYGPLGIFTCWLMWRDEKRAAQIKRNEDRTYDMQRDVMHRIDGLTKALLVDLIERETSGHETKRYAADAIQKIDARSARDNERRDSDNS